MKISLSQLFILILVLGLALALWLSRFQFSKAQESIKALSSQLRDQIESNAYSIHTVVIAHRKNVVVYTITVESTFQHAMQFTIRDYGESKLLSESYVDPTSNTWMSRIVLLGLTTGDSTEYYLSGVSGIPMGEATLIARTTTGLAELQGFGESGNGEFENPLQLDLEGQGRFALPFKTELLHMEFLERNEGGEQIEN